MKDEAGEAFIITPPYVSQRMGSWWQSGGRARGARERTEEEARQEMTKASGQLDV